MESTSAGTANNGAIENSAAVLFVDQTGNPGTNGSPSTVFPDFLGLLDESADDFTVPAGKVWTVDTFYIVGTYTVPGVLCAFRCKYLFG